MSNQTVRHIRGTFAPPLTNEKLQEYSELADNAPGSIKEKMKNLIEMVLVFRETPDSKNEGRPHPSGRGFIIPLEQKEIERIWDYVPWNDDGEDHINECNMIGELFEKIDRATNRELRNAAFHLLWFARELAMDREPITSDKI